MSEYRKQAAFLKRLMRYEDGPEHRLIGERLAVAEKNERCLLCACRLVGLIALLGMAGIGYSAVLLPQFFDNSTHVVIRFFTALGLGSTLCFAFFLGLWFWYRHATNRIHEECRRAISSMLDARLKSAPTTFHPFVVEDHALKSPAMQNISTIQTSVAAPVPELLDLPKAS
jgi:hypothetical protein